VLATSLLEAPQPSHGAQAVGDLAGAPVYLELARA
jgi:hypothetical protein